MSTPQTTEQIIINEGIKPFGSEKETETKECCECGEKVTKWWEEKVGDEIDYYCLECNPDCDGCGWGECHLCREESEEEEAEIDYEKWTWAQNVLGPAEECKCKCGRWFSTDTPWCPVCTAKEFKWTEAMMLKAKMVPLED